VMFGQTGKRIIQGDVTQIVRPLFKRPTSHARSFPFQTKSASSNQKQHGAIVTIMNTTIMIIEEGP
jgi:hypothetical protein